VGGETIVVADDEAALRRLVSRVLGDLGYKVFVAGNGPEALELVEDLESAPDLLVTDVILPGGLQGNELAQRLTAAVPGLPVLYMSGHPRDAIMHAGRLDYGVFFLSKPFTPQELAAKIQEVLGSAQND
jgi:CheY-like chemotaxis protein